MAEWLQRPFSEQFLQHHRPPLDYAVYCSHCGYELEELIVTERNPNYVDAGRAAVFLPKIYEYVYPDYCPYCKIIMRG